MSTSSFPNLRIVVSTAPLSAVQYIPYLGPVASQLNTDSDFYYDPITQTLVVPNFTPGGSVFSGDIEFTKEVDHEIFVASSDP
jgi:hypothetical protein